MLTTHLSDHLVLVTGGTGGIGKATGLALASLGGSIAVHYNTAADTAEELIQPLQAKSARATAFQAHLGNDDDVRRLHAEVASFMGDPSIVFNNVGLAMGKGGVKERFDIGVEEVEQIWRKAWGWVIFCGSLAGFPKGSISPHHASLKSAMRGLIYWLAGAYAKKGITVNGVAPALIGDTTMLPGVSQELAKRKSHNLPFNLSAGQDSGVFGAQGHNPQLSTPTSRASLDKHLQRNTGGEPLVASTKSQRL